MRSSQTEINVRLATHSDHARLTSLYCCPPWNKPADHWARYQKAMSDGDRLFIVGEVGSSVAGFVTLIWHSNHPAFIQDGLPEISDLNVHPDYRSSGLGNAMMALLEDEARSRGFDKIGLGVGLYADYGSAQRLYVRRGYMPDGTGLYYGNKHVHPGQTVRVDDDLFQTMAKDL